MSEETQAQVRYFAYGSNMNRAIFESRRGIRPIRAQPALLENYRLRFNLAIGPRARCSQPGVSSRCSHLGSAVLDHGRTVRASRPYGRCPKGRVPSHSSSRHRRWRSADRSVHISVRQDQPWAKALSTLPRLAHRRCCSAWPTAGISPLPAKFRVGRGRAAVSTAAIVGAIPDHENLVQGSGGAVNVVMAGAQRPLEPGARPWDATHVG